MSRSILEYQKWSISSSVHPAPQQNRRSNSPPPWSSSKSVTISGVSLNTPRSTTRVSRSHQGKGIIPFQKFRNTARPS
ncbi:hypothetical protein LB505_010407 [Fusarium chuoi]|nr:hypothetical protein LB505_010407 [Fusarium chuoi]